MRSSRIRDLGLVLLLSIPFYCTGQDTTQVMNKHQIGFNASKFISLFNEQTNSLEITYRMAIKQPYSIRAGLSFEQNTADDGIFDGSLRIGADKYFKKTRRWDFYYGMDAFLSREVVSSSERENVRFGGFVFLGILFHIGDHFSLSTEPNFSVLRVVFRDDDSFDPEANREWYEYSVGNIGQIQLNFHF